MHASPSNLGANASRCTTCGLASNNLFYSIKTWHDNLRSDCIQQPVVQSKEKDAPICMKDPLVINRGVVPRFVHNQGLWVEGWSVTQSVVLT
eukprot:3484728-Amphidinium_carterae.1